MTSATEADGRAELSLADGTRRVVDHVILGTGYKVDVEKYGFLGSSILESLACVNGYPTLGQGLESSVAGLHFLGAPAARSFGPIMRFVSGSWFAGQSLSDHLAGT